MALTEDNGMVMPVAPIYGNGGGNGSGGMGWGGDWGWIILLLLLAGGNGWGGGFGGGFGNAQLGYDFPWLMNGQQGIVANTNYGFQNALLNDNVTSIRDGVSALSTQLCSCCGDIAAQLSGGFAGVNAAVTGAQNAIAQQLYSNQIADLERSYAAQTANTAAINGIGMSLQNCCCENRAATADLKYAVAQENCADRAALADSTRDIIASQTASTQRILDQLCSDKIEQKNDIIAQLRSELMYARGQASQDVQTAAIQAGQRALANEVEQYVLPTPRPAYIVQNPNCCQQNLCGCGCGVG